MAGAALVAPVAVGYAGCFTWSGEARGAHRCGARCCQGGWRCRVFEDRGSAEPEEAAVHEQAGQSRADLPSCRYHHPAGVVPRTQGRAAGEDREPRRDARGPELHRPGRRRGEHAAHARGDARLGRARAAPPGGKRGPALRDGAERHGPPQVCGAPHARRARARGADPPLGCPVQRERGDEAGQDPSARRRAVGPGGHVPAPPGERGDASGQGRRGRDAGGLGSHLRDGQEEAYGGPARVAGLRRRPRRFRLALFVSLPRLPSRVQWADGEALAESDKMGSHLRGAMRRVA
mmetsp:Transcript_48471/g.149751  ORF Transcript_48471/g.149751 Transcript_48471/m.149751 type:complete len:291 (-) Transcript_48471:99-971(-)